MKDLWLPLVIVGIVIAFYIAVKYESQDFSPREYLNSIIRQKDYTRRKYSYCCILLLSLWNLGW